MTSKIKTDPNTTIDITIEDDRWPDLEQEINKAARAALTKSGFLETCGTENIEISVALANDTFIRELNKTYRGTDKATNVLSFPQFDDEMVFAASLIALGDIVMAYETIEREASEQHKSLKDHSIHLFIHGLLHLTGHDHDDDDEAEAMEALEIEILSALGIKNPYEAQNSVA